MITRLFLLIVLPLISISAISQEEKLLSSLLIPSELSKESNAIVRWDNVNIEIKAHDKMVYTNKRIVTITNSSGDSKHGAVIFYDNHINIKKLEVKIYDAFGNEIKKVRKNDFEDVSAVGGGTLYSDSRVKYLNYTPTSYPYTVLFDTEVEYSSTGFIPQWHPLEGYYTSTENANYKIVNLTDIPVKVKTSNFEGFNIEKINDFEYSARNLTSIKPESYSPDFSNYRPFLKAAMIEFEMEGVKGSNNDWVDFGKWMNDKLIKDTQALPDKVKDDIRLLTSTAQTDIEKAKIVYNYVQNKTRYVSVQVGIGGWKPMLASDVDRLGYGDCKGLTNYTKALLDEVGVESFYTVIYGDRDLRDIDSDFSSIQGNHVILCLPNQSDYIWLECTNQTSPFGYNANFTDDRDALIITPEGGKIVHTTIYETKGNLLNTYATIHLDSLGNFEATIQLKSYGTQYGYHEGIQNQTLKNQELHYKEYWSHINPLNIKAMDYLNDKDSIMFNENIKVTSDRYAIKAGNSVLLQPNIFNRMVNVPPRYDERILPFKIERGFIDEDTYKFFLPDNLEVDTLMNEVHITNKFGEFSASIVQHENNQLLYSRKLLLNKGSYSKEDYEAYRTFWLEIIKHDKSKIVLKNKL